MQRPKFILIDIVLSSSCVMEKQELFLILIALFHFICLGVFFFYEAFQNRKLLCLFNTFYSHTAFI